MDELRPRPDGAPTADDSPEERALEEAARQASERVLRWRTVRAGLKAEAAAGVCTLFFILANFWTQYLLLNEPAPRFPNPFDSGVVNPMLMSLRLAFVIGVMLATVLSVVSRILGARAPRDSRLSPKAAVAAVLFVLGSGAGGFARWASAGRTGLLPGWLVAVTWMGTLLGAAAWLCYFLYLRALAVHFGNRKLANRFVVCLILMLTGFAGRELAMLLLWDAPAQTSMRDLLTIVLLGQAAVSVALIGWYVLFILKGCHMLADSSPVREACAVQGNGGAGSAHST
jgi:hypothetical protein